MTQSDIEKRIKELIAIGYAAITAWQIAYSEAGISIDDVIDGDGKPVRFTPIKPVEKKAGIA